MLKKWTKAALFAATAMLLLAAGTFTSCSDGGDDDEKKDSGVLDDSYLKIEDGVVIGYYYDKMPSDGHVKIPDGVTSIGDGAFYLCKTLTSIDIPASVTSIGESAFYLCETLTSVEISASTINISEKAFYLCSALKSITIAGSVDSLGESAFSSCSSLGSVEFDCKEIGAYAFASCSALTSVKITGVESIGEKAFQFCRALKTASITGDAATLEKDVFAGCTNLESVEFDGKEIEGLAFYNDDFKNLKSVTIGENVTSIGFWAFYGRDALESVQYKGTLAQWAEIFNDEKLLEYPESIKMADGTDLKTMTEITAADLNGAKKIEKYAFSHLPSLKTVTIPKNVTRIGYSAFSGCTALAQVVFEDTKGWRYTESDAYTDGLGIDVSGSEFNAGQLRSILGKWALAYLYKSE